MSQGEHDHENDFPGEPDREDTFSEGLADKPEAFESGDFEAAAIPLPPPEPRSKPSTTAVPAPSRALAARVSFRSSRRWRFSP